MATTRQTAIFGVEDWKQIYQTYREADFQSYDFETLRKSFVDYLRLYYPETFNDYIESSEFIALLDVMAFMGQALAFRTDLNTRENYIDTAERRDSVVQLANLVSYTANATQKHKVCSKYFLLSQQKMSQITMVLISATSQWIGQILPTPTGKNNSPLSSMRHWLIPNVWDVQEIDRLSWVCAPMNMASI